MLPSFAISDTERRVSKSSIQKPASFYNSKIQLVANEEILS